MTEHTPFFFLMLDRLQRERQRSDEYVEQEKRRVVLERIKQRRADHEAMIMKDYNFEKLMEASGQTVRVTLDYLRWTQHV